MNPIKVDFAKACSDSVAIYKANFVSVLVATAIALLLGCVSAGLLMGVMLIPLMGIVLRLIDKDATTPAPKDLFTDKFTTYLVPGLIVSVIMIVTSPIALFVSPILFLACVRIADKGDVSPVGALKEVAQTLFKVEGGVMLYVLAIAALFIGALGCVLCGIGFFVTMPFGLLVLGSLYRQAFPKA